MFGSFLAPRLMDDWGGDDSGGSSSSSSSSGSRSSGGWKKSRAANGLRAAGQSLSASGNQMMSDSRDEAASKIGAVQYRKGGKVRKSKRSEKVMRKSKMRAGAR